MPDEAAYNKVLGDLRAIFAELKPGEKTYDEIVANRDQVFAKYRPVFSAEHIPNLVEGRDYIIFPVFRERPPLERTLPQGTQRRC